MSIGDVMITFGLLKSNFKLNINHNNVSQKSNQNILFYKRGNMFPNGVKMPRFDE